VGQGNHVLDGGPELPWKGVIFSGKGRPVVRSRDIVRSCAKTAESIEMPFGLWAPIGSMNHVLDGSPQVLRDVTVATIFGFRWALITSVCDS